MSERLAYRIVEFAEAVGCSRAKAYELVARGEIETIKVGKDNRIPVTSAKAWIDKQLKANRRG